MPLTTALTSTCYLEYYDPAAQIPWVLSASLSSSSPFLREGNLVFIRDWDRDPG